jgi:hypothetical protein
VTIRDWDPSGRAGSRSDAGGTTLPVAQVKEYQALTAKDSGMITHIARPCCRRPVGLDQGKKFSAVVAEVCQCSREPGREGRCRQVCRPLPGFLPVSIRCDVALSHTRVRGVPLSARFQRARGTAYRSSHLLRFRIYEGQIADRSRL